MLSVFHRKIALFEIRLEFLERTQRRPAAVNGHFSNSVGRSIHLHTQMGDDTNKIYESPRYPRRVKHEDNEAAIVLNRHNSDVTIYESLPLTSQLNEEEYLEMH